MRRNLPYAVECDRGNRWFETIAAFDCESAAVRYATSCAEHALPGFNYRIRVNKTIRVIPSGAQPTEYRR